MKPIHAFFLAFATTGFLIVGGVGTTADLAAAPLEALGPITLPTI